MNAHVEAARAHIAVAESGDSRRAAYEAAADELAAAQAEDPDLTNTELGRQLGKSRDYVARLLGWRADPRGADTPYVGDSAARRERAERQVPTQHADRVEMAAKLLADPEVTKAVARDALASGGGRFLAQAVRERDQELRAKAREAERQTALDKALPLPAYMAKMVVKIGEWSGSLAALADDLEDLPEGRPRELVLLSIRGLIEQAQRWEAALEPSRLEQVDGLYVIEGEIVA